MAQNAQTPDEEEARKELLATIAASRDLGPEMDQTLADRYIEQRQKATKTQSRSVAPAPMYPPVGQAGQPPQVGQFNHGPRIFLRAGGLVMVGIIVAAIVTQKWEILGFLWLAIFMCGPAFGVMRRGSRQQRRYYRRYGRWDEGYGVGAPMQQPPMVGAPPSDLPPAYQPQPTPTTAPARATQPLPPTPPINPAG